MTHLHHTHQGFFTTATPLCWSMGLGDQMNPSLTGAVDCINPLGDRRDDPRRVDTARHHDIHGEPLSSEHAIEKVPLSEIREGDMVQDPTSGRWIKVTHTADDTASGHHRVYYGDGGEEIDSRYVVGLVNRQVRE